MEEVLHLMNALFCQVYNLVFFIYDEIAGLGDLLTHNGCHLGHFAAGLASLQLSCEDIADLIKLGGFAALTGNDQRGTGFINQDRVHLVDDGVMKFSLYQLLFIDHHIVTKVVETVLVVGYISDITGILGTALVIVHGVQDTAAGQSQEAVNLSHLLGITVCQVIVDGDDMDSFSLQGV